MSVVAKVLGTAVETPWTVRTCGSYVRIVEQFDPSWASSSVVRADRTFWLFQGGLRQRCHDKLVGVVDVVHCHQEQTFGL